jgi:putative toxin-antitoxin system antitoxin component (TIGR02293 family)
VKEKSTNKNIAAGKQKQYALTDTLSGNTANDRGVAYAATLKGSYLNAVAHTLAGKVQALKDLLQPSQKEDNVTTYEKIDLINRGISKKDLEYLKQKSGLDYDKLAEVLSVARATLINKKGTEKFNTSLSEKIVSLADIYAYGYEVFEDEARFNTWIFRPNQALGGKMPYAFLSNQYGREEIKNLIGRIAYGVYA